MIVVTKAKIIFTGSYDFMEIICFPSFVCFPKFFVITAIHQYYRPVFFALIKRGFYALSVLVSTVRNIICRNKKVRVCGKTEKLYMISWCHVGFYYA